MGKQIRAAGLSHNFVEGRSHIGIQHGKQMLKTAQGTIVGKCPWQPSLVSPSQQQAEQISWKTKLENVGGTCPAGPTQAANEGGAFVGG